MPRGQKPKIYDLALVQAVARLYAQNKTQAEIAAALGRSQKVIWNLMRRHGLVDRCDVCGTTEPGKHYDWANLTGRYEDVNDYKRMCRSCHFKHDGLIKNIPAMRKGGA